MMETKTNSSTDLNLSLALYSYRLVSSKITLYEIIERRIFSLAYEQFVLPFPSRNLREEAAIYVKWFICLVKKLYFKSLIVSYIPFE